MVTDRVLAGDEILHELIKSVGGRITRKFEVNSDRHIVVRRFSINRKKHHATTRSGAGIKRLELRLKIVSIHGRGEVSSIIVLRGADASGRASGTFLVVHRCDWLLQSDGVVLRVGCSAAVIWRGWLWGRDHGEVAVARTSLPQGGLQALRASLAVNWAWVGLSENFSHRVNMSRRISGVNVITTPANWGHNCSLLSPILSLNCHANPQRSSAYGQTHPNRSFAHRLREAARGHGRHRPMRAGHLRLVRPRFSVRARRSCDVLWTGPGGFFRSIALAGPAGHRADRR
jgi:hypothetical protein